MLIEQIRNDMHEAKKVKDTDKANLLSTLFSEMFTLSKSGKAFTEEDAVKVVKKFLKNTNETLTLDIPEASKQKYLFEKSILENYLPKQMSASEIEEIVNKLLSENKAMKDIMSYFKENHSGMYDGKTVSEIIKAKLT
jgi:uncharacterized protein